MASCSSSSHLSSHPYCDDWSRLTTSLESRKEWRSLLSRFLSSSRREGLLPPPRRAHAYHHHLPHWFCQLYPICPLISLTRRLHPISQQTMKAGDLTWAATSDLSPLSEPIAMILGLTGTVLQHPSPCLIPMTFGTILPFHTVPTSPPTAVPLITGPLPQLAIGMSSSGTSLYRPAAGTWACTRAQGTRCWTLPDPLLAKHSPAAPRPSLPIPRTPEQLVAHTERSMGATPDPSQPIQWDPRTQLGQAKEVTPLLRDSLRWSTSTASMNSLPSHPPSCWWALDFHGNGNTNLEWAWCSRTIPLYAREYTATLSLQSSTCLVVEY